MEIKNSVFEKSITSIDQITNTSKPEFGFVGRSNVGKSSLINMLLNRKKLAKTSQKPGCTRTINYIEINDSWYIVDLPGYGYAKRSKTERKSMSGFLKEYILYSKNLLNLFVLLDARIEPQKKDLQFMEWLGIKEIPFSMIFTKIDKISSNELSKNMMHYQKEMLKTWAFLPPTFKTSSVSKQGREQILNYMEEILKSVDN